jgi:hypothetical protein
MEDGAEADTAEANKAAMLAHWKRQRPQRGVTRAPSAVAVATAVANAPPLPPPLSWAELTGLAAGPHSALHTLSRALFLSPFSLDALCGALTAPTPTPLLAEVHVTLLRVLLPKEVDLVSLAQTLTGASACCQAAHT